MDIAKNDKNDSIVFTNAMHWTDNEMNIMNTIKDVVMTHS